MQKIRASVRICLFRGHKRYRLHPYFPRIPIRIINVENALKININAIPHCFSDKFSKPNYVVVSMRLQNHYDIDYLINKSTSWDDDKVIGINATNHEHYSRAFFILNAFIY